MTLVSHLAPFGLAMPKLYQNRTNYEFYTRMSKGGAFFTMQVHPDGAAYLKWCGVKLEGEISSSQMDVLRTHRWLFTKGIGPKWEPVEHGVPYDLLRPLSLGRLIPETPSPTRRPSTSSQLPLFVQPTPPPPTPSAPLKREASIPQRPSAKEHGKQSHSDESRSDSSYGCIALILLIWFVVLSLQHHRSEAISVFILLLFILWLAGRKNP